MSAFANLESLFRSEENASDGFYAQAPPPYFKYGMGTKIKSRNRLWAQLGTALPPLFVEIVAEQGMARNVKTSGRPASEATGPPAIGHAISHRL